MYISEFWCGAGATVIAEIVGMIIYAVVSTWEKKRR